MLLHILSFRILLETHLGVLLASPSKEVKSSLLYSDHSCEKSSSTEANKFPPFCNKSLCKMNQKQSRVMSSGLLG